MACLEGFAMLHLDNPKDTKNNVAWTDETKTEMFGENAQFITRYNPYTNCQARQWSGDDLGLFLQLKTWKPCSH